MKKGFSKKLISTSLVEIYYSNTYKENGCFSCEKGIHGNTDLRIYGTIMVNGYYGKRRTEKTI